MPNNPRRVAHLIGKRTQIDAGLAMTTSEGQPQGVSQPQFGDVLDPQQDAAALRSDYMEMLKDQFKMFVDKFFDAIC